MNKIEYFNRNKKLKSEKIKLLKASQEHLNFVNYALEIFSTPLEEYGFIRQKTEIEQYFSSITFKKLTSYIKIQSTTHPRDMNDCYNIILGDGDSEDFYELDWNSVSLWKIKKFLEPNVNAHEYSFPHGEKAEYSLKNGLNELLKYGQTFINGDLNTFVEVRKNYNKNREPYKIYEPGKNGSYIKKDEPISVEKKKKYS
jgi:hypothetical protein